MDTVYEGYNPQPASSSRASRCVAPIANLEILESNQPTETKAVRYATRSSVKRTSRDDERVVGEITTVPDSTPIIDQANDKRVKLDAAETESTLLAEIQKEMPVTDSQALSNYNEAFTLLKENPPEQRLDIQLPYETFRQLDNAFSELKSEADISEDQRYPSLAYNSLTQTVTVVTAPSSIHEGTARWINDEVRDFVKDYLSTRRPQTLQRIRQVGSTTKHFPLGGYTRSRKEPDGGFIYQPLGGPSKMVIAIEVGYSEVYGKLLEDKDMWINGKGVNVVILACFKERPRFDYPATSHYRDITDWRAEGAVMETAVGETAQFNAQQGYYGPLWYRDHMWAGKLEEAYIEVWRQDSHDRFYLIQEGFRVALGNLPRTLGLRVSDLYPHDVWQAEDIEDHLIPFDSAGFLEGLRFDIVTAAKDRFEGFLFDKLRLT
ncbi:hypothetical protein V1517DRAFT_263697 [Lipomyces orientalis]|uniref:Uncharacterized protein n=1 Tax=Lipomyces orientalis TaxID=1233043 RepID=A0ACC3TJ97_9ASCO